MPDKGLKSFFSNPFTDGISDSYNFESARRILSNSVVGITLVAVSFFWALLCFFWGLLIPAYVFVVAGICGFILVWIFIRRKNILFVTKYATFAIFFAIFTLEWLTGGIRSPAIYWVCAIPVIAIFFNGLEQGLKWSVLVVVGACLFAFLDIKGYPVPNFIPEGKEAIIRILSPSSLFFAIFIMSVFYELNTRRAILKVMGKQRELIASERRFRDVATSMADLIWELDTSSVVTYCSEGIKHTLGFEPQELIGNSPATLMPPDEVARSTGEFMGLFKARKLFKNIKRTYIHKDGREVRLLSSGVPVFDEDGRFCGYRGVDRDITEQEQMEDALRKSEERLHGLFVRAPIGIYRSTIGPKGKFLIVNPAMVKIFGYQKQDELLDIHVSDLYQDPKERKVFSDAIIKYGYVNGKVLKLKRKDGTPVICQLFAVFCRDEEGTPPYADGFVIDITEGKQAEEARIEAEAQLHQAQKMEAIGTLAGGIAHDFNNLLTVIIGNLSLAKAESSKPLQYHIENALEAAGRSTDLIQQILLFSRRAQSVFHILNLGPVVKETVKFLRQIVDRRIDIHTHVEPDLWMCNVDIGQIQQVIMNFVVNARDAIMEGLENYLKTPSGRIDRDLTITVGLKNMIIDKKYVSLHPKSREGEFVVFSVSDNGTGMDKETLQHIFEPFFTTKDKDKGTGLGLSTIHGIVQQHKGWIDIYSKTGKGSTFYVYLPCASEEGDKKKARMHPHQADQT